MEAILKSKNPRLINLVTIVAEKRCTVQMRWLLVMLLLASFMPIARGEEVCMIAEYIDILLCAQPLNRVEY